MKKPDKARLNIVITDEARDELQRVSENHGMSMQALVREYIAKGLTIETYQEDFGGDVTVNLPNGQQFPILNPIENKKRRLLGGD